MQEARVRGRQRVPALGTSKGTTKLKGTISGTHASVKVSDEQDVISWGVCTGSRKFAAAQTTGFH